VKPALAKRRLLAKPELLAKRDSIRRALRAAAVLVFLLGLCAWAQQPEMPRQVPPGAAGAHSPQAASQAGQEEPAEGLLENYEHEEQEEHAEFKYSAAVRWISRATGLPVTGAYWLAMILNFAIIAGAVLWFWRMYAPAGFRARTAAIQKGMEEARLASQDANRRLADVESRLGRLDAEIATLRSEAEAQAAAEEERMRAAAEEDKARIIDAARQEIEAAGRQARRELKTYAAGLAVSLAEKRIQVDPAADRVLFHGFVEQLANGEKG
jgi:F-type H+-transporting ATPase subunit b